MEHVGIIGFGNMGSVIAEQIKNEYSVIIFDKDKSKTINSRLKVLENVVDLVNNVDVVILAVKPQDFAPVLEEIKNYIGKKIVISIAAGITTTFIEKIIGDAKIIRTMPNLAARFGKGITWLCRGKKATDVDLNISEEIFNYLGKTFIIEEAMMNAATAVSGSGPGFYFALIENKPESEWEVIGVKRFIPELTFAAEALGFDKKTSNLAAALTYEGSFLTVKTGGLSAAELKKQVASKGGTTEAGLEVLLKTGSLIKAVEVAAKRAEELSR